LAGKAALWTLPILHVYHPKWPNKSESGKVLRRQDRSTFHLQLVESPLRFDELQVEGAAILPLS